jgi:hypothetical protein
MWSQYVPVRIEFTDLDASQRDRLFAWAQLSASRFDGSGAANVITAASASFQWIQQHLNWAWQSVAPNFAQQPRTDDGDRNMGSEAARDQHG